MNNIRELQKVLLEILIEISNICEENMLEYWLDSGTLLGAVRHKGFIPWDDDIDIVMPRGDYEKFLEKILNNKIKLSNNLEVDYCMTASEISPWIKIRNKNSYFKEIGQKISGIFVDIFPVDFLDDRIKEKFYEEKRRYKKQYRILRNRGFIIERPLIKNIRYNVLWMGRSVVSKIVGKYRENIYKELNEKLNDYKNIEQIKIIEYGIEIPWFNLGVRYEDVYPLKKIYFEGYSFNAPNNHDSYLIKLYGNDYMVIPQKEGQIIHNIEFKILNDKS